jgi:signal transduction histidine kinase
MAQSDAASPVATIAPARLAAPLARWRGLSLAQQFALAGSVVVLLGMLAIGMWVGERIKRGVIQNSAIATALYMDSFVEPLVQELDQTDVLSATSAKELDELLSSTTLGRRVVSIKIWKRGGLVSHSTWKDQIGKRFQPTANLRRAWAGIVSAELGSHSHEDDHHERSLRGPLLEIYAPVRARNSDRIIAVAEFYEVADELMRDLRRAVSASWLVVGFVGALMLAALYGIVRRGSRTIERQQSALETQIGELQELLDQNEELRGRVERARIRSAEINDAFLRRVGSDLHDGPAQMMGLALLRLDGLKPHLSGGKGDDPTRALQTLEAVRGALGDAMRDVRQISAGLALPELRHSTIEEVLQMAARAHERRTETKVALDIGPLPAEAPEALKVCLYRFQQEALSNAYRHADGKGQLVRARAEGSRIEVEVADQGRQGANGAGAVHNKGLGLAGLRDRIETLGGTLEIGSADGGGTKLIARFDIKALANQEGAFDV